MSKITSAILFCLIALCCSLTTHAQTSAFTFQGRLTDSGLPSTGTYTMLFEMYDAVSGGTQVGTTANFPSVTVANGVFTVVLDFGATPFSASADRWLEVSVKKPAESGFTLLTPRQQIMSSPYSVKSMWASAAYSLSADCVGCVDDIKIDSVSGSKVTGTVANATTAGNITGVVAVANGGTGSATGNASALTNITPANISPGTAPINIVGIAANPLAVTSGAMPSALGRTMLTLDYASATAITDLTGGIEGQCIVLLSLNGNASIADAGNFKLASNWSPFISDTITVCRSSATGSPFWYETSRSNNAQVFSLFVTLAGTGSGTVTSSPAGINCGADCTEVYATDTVVTLTPVAGATSIFAGWSGGGCSGTGTCVTTMSASTTVVATFDLITYVLTVNKSGTGTGTVTSSPGGINCGANCAALYTDGTFVVLSATPSGGSTFLGWSGSGCSGTGSCVVSMTTARTVTAAFQPPIFLLTAAKAGAGLGTVTSIPGGINCGADCTEFFGGGSSVTLTATATAGSIFAGWSGGGCSGTGTCVITITGPVTIIATFDSLGPALLTLAPLSNNFGSTNLGLPTATVDFTVTNTGGASSGSIVTQLTGTDATEFQVTADTCNGNVLSPSSTCTVTVRFNPMSAGNKAATLGVQATPGGLATSTLFGIGI